MRSPILLGLIIMTSDLVAQDVKNLFYQDTITVMTGKCHEEIELAKVDYEKNLFVIELLKPIPFTDTQQKVLFEQYGVQSVYREGLIAPDHDCYNFYLKTLAKGKWRHDIFKRSKFIADSLDKSGLGDQQAKFRTGDNEFYEFIETNLSNKTKKRIRENNDLKTLYIKVDISETGGADNIRIINSLHYGDVEIEILTLLKEKQLWIPETDNGKGVKTWIIYPIKVEDL